MQTIDYGAIIQNAEYFKKLLGNSKLCAVLKNDAYGHGIVRTASALSQIADYFAVGNVREALKIAPYSKNVLILLPIFDSDVKVAVQNNFILTVDSFETLKRVVANTPNGHRARVHLKIDSGMNRLGFTLRQLPKLIHSKELSQVKVEGVFSHFFGETETQCDKQLAVFEQAKQILLPTFTSPPLFHIANTSATLLNSKYHLDMARVGLGLYGYGAKNLVTAKTVTAQVVAVKKVCAGQTVGYGATYTFPKDTTIAVLNSGYANGFVRALKNSSVKLCGQLCKVVGNICMAMCMVDVRDLPVKVGDVAVLLGENVNNANNQVIVYELLCNLR